jgi:hypothetical protein
LIPEPVRAEFSDEEVGEMTAQPRSVAEYLESLPEPRRAAIEAVRGVILANLPKGYHEGIQYGMIGYFVPLERFPETYNGQPLAYVGLANQKSYMSLYLMGVYGDAESDFRERFAATGKKLDMGKSCVRFRRLDDLPLDVIGDEVRRVPVDRFIEQYVDARASSNRRSGGRSGR